MEFTYTSFGQLIISLKPSYSILWNGRTLLIFNSPRNIHKMSSKLAFRTTFISFGLYYHHNPAKRVRKPHLLNLGIRTNRFNRTFCQLKRSEESNDRSSLKAQFARIGFEGLFGLAAMALNKVIMDNAGGDNDTSAEAKQPLSEPSQMEGGISDFRPDVTRLLVKRPKDAEVLILEGIEILAPHEMVKFDVYISKPLTGNMLDSDYGEFVGNETDVVYERNSSKGSLELGITHLVEAIGADESEYIVVTVVPITGKVMVGGVRIAAMAKGVSGNMQIRNFFAYRKDETRKHVMINLEHEFQISKTITRDVSTILWLVSYVMLLLLFKDVWADLTKMMM